MSKKKQEQQSAYKDVSDADQEEVAAEQQVRRSGQFTGGGPFSKEELLARHTSKPVKR